MSDRCLGCNAPGGCAMDRRSATGSFVHAGIEHRYDLIIHVDQTDTDFLMLNEDYHFDDYTIPRGFVWDGASTPNAPLARFLAPKYHKNIRASCIHDFLCRIAKNSEDRRKADSAYYIAKKYIEKDHPLRSKIAWLGVRIGAFLGVGNYYKKGSCEAK